MLRFFGSILLAFVLCGLAAEALRFAQIIP